jgi:hypothetical protein
MSDPKDPTTSKPTSESIKEAVEQHSPLHESVFGSDPDGFVNDTPRGAIGANVNIIGSAVQLDRNQPLRHIGDSDQGDFQPDNLRRR